jgi:hypothetical protein
LYAHKNICKKKLVKKKKKNEEKEKRKKNNPAQIGTNVKARVLNVGLLARSQFASRRS